ncbi:C-GCAxxG-C-C family protein [Chloroflexota bacterium]
MSATKPKPRKTKPTKKQILDEVQKRAHKYHKTYTGCAQCALLPLQEIFNLEDDLTFKASSVLCGGLGGTSESACGALAGSSLALGLKYGRGSGELEDRKKVTDSLLAVAKLCKWFELEFGAIYCRDLKKRLVGVYLDNRINWQKEKAEELGLRDKCADVVAKTARKAAELLMEDEKKLMSP